jgi:DNA-binding transcriptional regulator YdaS (Cro superfamily)
MLLKPYLKTLDSEPAREAFAARCGTSLGHLTNVANGHRSCSTELAVAIERESKKSVTRPELCPDTWSARWPELVRLFRRHSAKPQAVKGA